MNNLLDDTVNSLLNANSNLSDEHSNFCPICGAKNTVGSRFCRECGEKLPEVKQEPVAAENPSEVMNNSSAEQTNIALQNENVSDSGNVVKSEDINENGLTLTCPFCGTANRSIARFCRECGQGIANAEDNVAQNDLLDNVLNDLMGGSDNEVEKIAPLAVTGIAANVADTPEEKPVEIELPGEVQEVAAIAAEDTPVQNSLLDDAVSDLLGGAVDDTSATDSAVVQDPVAEVPAAEEKIEEPLPIVEEPIMQEPVREEPVFEEEPAVVEELIATEEPAVTEEPSQVSLEESGQTASNESAPAFAHVSGNGSEDLPQQPEKEEKSNKNLLYIAAGVVLVALLGFAGFRFLGNSEEKAVKNFITAINENKFDAAYKELDIKEESLTNAQAFAKFVSGQIKNKNTLYGKLQGKLGEVKLLDKKENGNVVAYNVNAIIDNNPVSIPVRMNKETKKILLDSNVIGPVKVKLPVATEMTIDGAKFDKSFELKSLFAGSHAITLKNPFYEWEYAPEFVFEPEKTKEIKVWDMVNVKRYNAEKINAAAMGFLNPFFAATIANQGLKHDGIKYIDDVSIENMYQKINAYVQKNGITQMQVTGAEHSGITLNRDGADGKITPKFTFSGNYQKGGTTGTIGGNVDMVLEYQKGELIVSKINSYNLRVRK